MQMSMPIMPVAKNGACPSGYHAEGNMCVPSANAKPVIAKNGPCPSGWHAEGNYCVANASNPKNVIPKMAPARLDTMLKAITVCRIKFNVQSGSGCITSTIACQSKCALVMALTRSTEMLQAILKQIDGTVRHSLALCLKTCRHEHAAR